MMAQYASLMAKQAKRAMMFTLVQPSPQLLLQFDKVVLMSKGSVVYFGPSSGVLEHTFRLGYRYAHQNQ